MSEHTVVIRWKRSGEDFLAGKYSREHTWSFDGGMTVAASSSPSVVPEPFSNAKCVDPEEAFVAAVSSCHMLWFLSIAAQRGLEVESYEDEALGLMAMNVQGAHWISTIRLRPKVTYRGENRPTSADANHLHHLAHERCFIANSIKTTVTVEPREESSRFADHFSGVANSYMTFRPRYPRPLFEWLASQAAGHDLAWDCATGSGQAAVGLADFFGKVIATDASAGQVAHALPHPGVEYRTALAEHSDLPAACADIITVAQAAHWLDLPRFYDEARRVAKPGALLAIWCYGEMRFGEPRIDAALDFYYHQVVGPYWPPERKHIEQSYRALFFPFHEIEAPPFELAAEFSRAQLLGYLRTWSATQRYMKAHGIDPVNGVDETLQPLWPDGQVLRTKKWPIHLRVTKLERSPGQHSSRAAPAP